MDSVISAVFSGLNDSVLAGPSPKALPHTARSHPPSRALPWPGAVPPSGRPLRGSSMDAAIQPRGGSTPGRSRRGGLCRLLPSPAFFPTGNGVPGADLRPEAVLAVALRDKVSAGRCGAARRGPSRGGPAAAGPGASVPGAGQPQLPPAGARSAEQVLPCPAG